LGEREREKRLTSREGAEMIYMDDSVIESYYGSRASKDSAGIAMINE
jgi:hypothetical protein